MQDGVRKGMTFWTKIPLSSHSGRRQADSARYFLIGGFHLHLLGFPFVYQFELQIELEPNLLVQNPVELIISPTFQIVLISCVT